VTTEQPPRARRRLGIGAAIVVALLALAVTVGIGILRGATAPVDEVPLAVATTGAAVTGSKLFVHVSGAVRVPGLYRLDDGARVVDAIAAAGGFTDGAAQDAVNLARPLTDGEQLIVPVAGAEPSSTGAAGAPGDGRVNLNTADADALDALPRIGPALAARIVAWREQNGRFTSVDDLLAVPGIGDKMLESLRDLVTV
jgi:competence protein ComEA